VRELALLVRAPEPGSNNLGEFVATNSAGLAQELGVSASWLETERIVDDAELAPRIRRLLERAKDMHVQQDLERRRDRSLAAAQTLGATARWTTVGAELDVDLLLGELLADRTKRWLGFVEPNGFTTVISRHLIAAAVPLRRQHLDLAASVSAVELAFAWRGGRGGYRWLPRTVDPQFADRGLIVPLASRRVQVPQRRRGGAWLGQILKEMGYAV
jgi:hypothetical protein